jgi:hypothetical protein
MKKGKFASQKFSKTLFPFPLSRAEENRDLPPMTLVPRAIHLKSFFCPKFLEQIGDKLCIPKPSSEE